MLVICKDLSSFLALRSRVDPDTRFKRASLQKLIHRLKFIQFSRKFREMLLFQAAIAPTALLLDPPLGRSLLL